MASLSAHYYPGPTFEHHFAHDDKPVVGSHGEEHARQTGNCHHDTEMTQLLPPCLGFKAHPEQCRMHTCWLSMLPPFYPLGIQWAAVKGLQRVSPV